MTPQQIVLVQRSFTKMLPSKRMFGRLFYARLFMLLPDIRPLFKGDIELHGERLVTALTGIVLCLDNLGGVLDFIRRLGQRHAGYGVVPAHYPAVGDALLRTLHELLGTDFTAEHREAWRAAYELLSQTMIEAMAERVERAA